MTDKKQPEALELASAAESADLAGYPTAEKANAYCLCLLEDCAHMIRRLHAENEALRAERESPALPEPDTHCFDDDTQKDVWSYSEGLVRSILASDRAMRAAQPAGAQQTGTAYAALPDKGLTPELTAALQRGADGVFDLLKDWHLINKDAKAGRRLWQIGRNLEGIFGCALRGDYTRASHGQAPAQAAPQQEAQEQAAVPRFNCWTTNDGDSWFDHPADSQAIYDCLGNDAKVGDEYELTAGWRSVTARYRITEVVGDGEEYEVECISHQQENTAPQPPAAGKAVHQFRKQHCADWYDGRADHSDGGGPYEERTLYTSSQQEALEPVAWYVTGCGRLLDEYEAEDEARRIGGTAKAMPLYTVPQPSPASQGDALDAARYRYLQDVPMGLWPAELLSAIRLQQNAKWDAAIDAARAAQEGK